MSIFCLQSWLPRHTLLVCAFSVFLLILSLSSPTYSAATDKVYLPFVVSGGTSVPTNPTNPTPRITRVVLDSKGDYLGQGKRYEYTRDNAIIDAYGSPPESVRIVIKDATTYWDVQLGAPRGQALAPGTYENAFRLVERTPDQPSIDVSGNGRACTTSGRFTVQSLTFGPYYYVETFVATFEMRCSNSPAPMLGEIAVFNPPPVPPIDIQIGISSTGTVTKSGKAVVELTLVCNRPTFVNTWVSVTQGDNRASTTQGAPGFNCTNQPLSHKVEVLQELGDKLGIGLAQVEVSAQTDDPIYYNIRVSQRASGTTTLRN